MEDNREAFCSINVMMDAEAIMYLKCAQDNEKKVDSLLMLGSNMLKKYKILCRFFFIAILPHMDTTIFFLIPRACK